MKTTSLMLGRQGQPGQEGDFFLPKKQWLWCRWDLPRMLLHVVHEPWQNIVRQKNEGKKKTQLVLSPEVAMQCIMSISFVWQCSLYWISMPIHPIQAVTTIACAWEKPDRKNFEHCLHHLMKISNVACSNPPRPCKQYTRFPPGAEYQQIRAALFPFEDAERQ